MDYKELVGRLKAISDACKGLLNVKSTYMDDAASAITDLLARAETAEARAEKAERERDEYKAALMNWHEEG